MSIDLPRIVARLSRRRRPIKFRTTSLPGTTESALAAIYIKVPKAWRGELADRILPAYDRALASAKPLHDALLADDVTGLGGDMRAAGDSVNRLIVSLTPELRTWVVKSETIHRNQFVAAAKTAAGVDLGTILSVDGVSATMQAILERNVSLVTAVSDDVRRSIADIVFQGFTQRTPRRDLAADLDNALGLGRTRSLLIASDQTTKLSSTLDRERQQEIGIDKFIWRHSGKVHFRPEHKARDGNIYAWDDNDLDGDLPGVAINCGCKAQAYLEPAAAAPAAVEVAAPIELPALMEPGPAIASTSPVEPVLSELLPQFPAYQPAVVATTEAEAGVFKRTWVSESNFTTVEKVYSKAADNQALLAEAADRIAKDFGIKFSNPGVKGEARMREKINPLRPIAGVTDVVRGGFKVATPQLANDLIEALGREFVIADEGWKITPDGYFDRKVLVRFPDGMIGELQFWEPNMLAAKEELGGHKLYEQARRPDIDPLVRAGLVREMQALYGGVTDRLPGVWKAALGIA